MRKQLFLVLFLTGCTTTQQANETTGLQATAARSVVADVSPYITPADLDLTMLLPPPPAPDSASQQRDLKLVLAIQSKRTPTMERIAKADNQKNLSRFAEALDPHLEEQSIPLTTKFIAKIARDIAPLVSIAKDCWERPRPFVTSHKVHPPQKLLEELKMPPEAPLASVPRGPGSPCLPAPEHSPKFTYSYPSGHATFGTTLAIVLSKMVPEKRAALFARGWAYGYSRVVAGAHYPSDVEAGRHEAMALVAILMKNPQFTTDFEAARSELRTALGLTP